MKIMNQHSSYKKVLLFACSFLIWSCDASNGEDVVAVGDGGTASDPDGGVNTEPDGGASSDPNEFCENPVCPEDGVIRVKVAAGGCGTSWDDAMGDLQDALALAAECAPVQIWVAAGTYKPGQESTDTFQIVEGVDLFGGFSGTETKLDQRDRSANETILSGDLQGDDGDLPDWETPCGWSQTTGNSYHVVTGTSGAVLDGFTVTGGAAANWEQDDMKSGGAGMLNTDCDETLVISNCTFTKNCSRKDGAGMLNDNSAPRIVNCVFKDNDCNIEGSFGRGHGGGIANLNDSRPLVEDCVFSGNRAVTGGGMHNRNSRPEVIRCEFSENYAYWSGGGMSNESSPARISDCVFRDNSSSWGDGDLCQLGWWGGGAISNRASSPTIERCLFENNDGENGGAVSNGEGSMPVFSQCEFYSNLANCFLDSAGGALTFSSSSATITNCIFSDNQTNTSEQGSRFYGGAIFIVDPSPVLEIVNSTFVENSAMEGGAIFCGHQAEYQHIEPTCGNGLKVVNSIFSNNDPDQIVGDDVDITYSLVEGGHPGEGNIEGDPLFVDVEARDFHLQTGSPCIDTGDTTAAPPADFDGNLRVAEADIGAFEHIPES